MPSIPNSRAITLVEMELAASPTPMFDIPYFAHQQLNPKLYPNGVGYPIQISPARANAGKSKAKEDGDWSDEDSVDSDEDEDSANTTVNKKKRSRSSIQVNTVAEAKRLKLTGGRPAVAKKVIADMDSDDELIFNMKNAKFLEKDIAKRLADEGRTVYNPKTIGTRWARLKKVKQAEQDKLLDEELTDWHEGDDDVLYAGLDKANTYIERKIKLIEERRWRIVADYVKNVRPVTNFSQNACNKRYEALQAGTAKAVPESDPNPSPTVLARIEARRKRQERIDRDAAAAQRDDIAEANLEGNAWTSRQKDKYS